jgi:hypothetical protein
MDANKVAILVSPIAGGSFQLAAIVSTTATVGQAFSAILTLTLIG